VPPARCGSAPAGRLRHVFQIDRARVHHSIPHPSSKTPLAALSDFRSLLLRIWSAGKGGVNGGHCGTMARGVDYSRGNALRKRRGRHVIHSLRCPGPYRSENPILAATIEGSRLSLPQPVAVNRISVSGRAISGNCSSCNFGYSLDSEILLCTTIYSRTPNLVGNAQIWQHIFFLYGR
jgi:hypothetical protein